MKRGIERVIILIVGIIIGISFIFSYATSYNSSEITYDNSTSGSIKTNVKDAVDELYKLASIPKMPICIRAYTLHTTTCQSNTTNGCQKAGIASGATITYGNLGITGSLAAGDAFDCDVNGDGRYNAETERFYYITDLEGDNTKAVLLYYSNTSEGVATSSKTISYDSNVVNNQGPVTARADLPSTSQWKTTIYSNPRQIINENGGTTTVAGDIVKYDYGDRTARLITYQEIITACQGTSDFDSKCPYIIENTRYAGTSSLAFGYWLETPIFSGYKGVGGVQGGTYKVSAVSVDDASNYGARPAIEVPKSDIAY